MPTVRKHTVVRLRLLNLLAMGDGHRHYSEGQRVIGSAM